MPRLGPGAVPCESCGETSIVLETRRAKYGLRRVRQCPSCLLRWTTVEIDLDVMRQLLSIARSANSLRADLAALHVDIGQLPPGLAEIEIPKHARGLREGSPRKAKS